MREFRAGTVTYYASPERSRSFPAVHGFFTRRGGVSPPPYASLNAGLRGGDRPEHVRTNLERIAAALSVPAGRIFCAAQVHGDRVLRVSGSEPSVFGSDEPIRADGLVTGERGLYLGILTADCVPLLLLDPGRPAVGAVHAGWRGTQKGISAKAVRVMTAAFGCEPPELLAALGPAVGPCCYVVGDEVACLFLEGDPETGPFLRPQGPGRWTLNLAGVIRHQLMRSGVRHENIVSSSTCTCCRKDLFFSVRAEGDPTGRQISVIGLGQEKEGGFKNPAGDSDKEEGPKEKGA